MRTADGDFELELGGRLMLDAGFFGGDDGVDDGDRLDDGTVKARRARVGLGVTVFKVWHGELEYDFADGTPQVTDAFVSYTGFDPLEIRYGRYKEPFSLEESTSANDTTFMERGLPNVFAPGRNVGIALLTSGSNWSAAGGVFGGDVGEAFQEQGDEHGLTGRLTFAPWLEEQQAIHLGISATRRNPDQDEVRFRTAPESEVAEVSLLSTGNIDDIEDYASGVFEVAAVHGPYSLQGEFFRTKVERRNNLADLDFAGWYIYGSWFITGESRDYRARGGDFGSVEPRRRIGAFELALRLSQLDLNDGDVDGGREQNITAGLNWYINRYTRLMTNFVHVNTDAEAGNDEFDILQFRAQFNF